MVQVDRARATEAGAWSAAKAANAVRRIGPTSSSTIHGPSALKALAALRALEGRSLHIDKRYDRRLLFIDMEPEAAIPLRSSRSLLWLDRVLRLITVIFAVGTVIFIGLLGPLVGSGGVGVDATVASPLEVALPDGTTIRVQGDGQVDRSLGLETAAVHSNLRLGEDDTDSRVVLAASGIAFVVAFWVGLFMTRRIVRSARDGAPFEARNVSRLRLLAAMFAAIPVGAEVSRRLLQSTVDADPRITISIPSPDWGIYLLVALVLLALAEIFREGTALRELDEQTV